MRIVVMTEKAGWHSEDLRRAALSRGHKLVTCSWRALAASVGAGVGGGIGGGAVGDCVGGESVDFAGRRSGDIISSDSIQLGDADAVVVRTMPAGSLEQIVFRMDVLHSLERRGVTIVNSPTAVEISVDKYRSLSLMRDAGLVVPATVACQGAAGAVDAFVALGGDVVVKPLFGSEGFGVMRVADVDLARRVFSTLEQTQHVIYLQQFIHHVTDDVRVFVVGGQVIAAMKRVADDWRKNISRGASGQLFTPDEAMCEIAVKAAAACGADVAGVDLLRVEHAGNDGAVDVNIRSEGGVYALEVNASPGWRALSEVANVDVAERIVQFVEGKARLMKAEREDLHVSQGSSLRMKFSG